MDALVAESTVLCKVRDGRHGICAVMVFEWPLDVGPDDGEVFLPESLEGGTDEYL